MDLFNYLRTNKLLRKIYYYMPVIFKNFYLNRKSKIRNRVWTNSSIYKNQYDDLKLLKNSYKGEKCIIMGNGPSLKKTDWKLIKDKHVIGLNRINMLRKEMGFDPEFLVTIKDLVIEQFQEDIIQPNSIKFLDFKSASKLDRLVNLPNTFFISEKISLSGGFSKNLVDGWYRGYTVTYAAMQVAYYLGFEKVLLIGVDHNFKTKGPARKNIISGGEDPNHFDPNYFGKGVKWALPDLDGSERFYSIAKTVFEQDSREIIDCTIDGKLNIFRKSELEKELNDFK